MIRLLVFFVLLFLLYRALKSWIFKDLTSVGSNEKSGALQNVDDVMVKDPHCQAYFPKRNAVRLKQSGETLYFCSDECKQSYLAEIKKQKQDNEPSS